MSSSNKCEQIIAPKRMSYRAHLCVCQCVCCGVTLHWSHWNECYQRNVKKKQTIITMNDNETLNDSEGVSNITRSALSTSKKKHKWSPEYQRACKYVRRRPKNDVSVSIFKNSISFMNEFCYAMLSCTLYTKIHMFRWKIESNFEW